MHRRLRLVAAIAVALVCAAQPSAGSAAEEPETVRVAPIGDTGPDDPASAWYLIDGATFADGTVASAIGADRYGGFWWEGKGKDSAIVIGVKGLTDADAKLVTALSTASARLRFRNVRYSYAEVTSAQRAVVDYLTAEKLVFAVGLGGDVATDVPFAIEVRLDGATGAQRARIAALLPDDLEVLKIGPGNAPVNTSTDRRSPFQPYYSGEEIAALTQPNFVNTQCTTGFLMVGYYGYFGSAAGHCSARPPNDQTLIRIYDTPGSVANVDTVRQNHLYQMQPSFSDTLMYSLSLGGFSYQAKILYNTVNGVPLTRRVSGRHNGHVGMNGPTVCFQGVASDNSNCGTVIHQDVARSGASYPGGPLWYMQYQDEVNFPSIAGDSGGPVYTVEPDLSAKAAGIISGGVVGVSCYYSQINYVVYLSGLEVATS